MVVGGIDAEFLPLSPCQLLDEGLFHCANLVPGVLAILD